MSKMIARIYDGVDKEQADIIYNTLVEHMNKKDVIKAYDAALFEIKGEVHITNVVRGMINKSHIVSMECESEETIKIDPRVISFAIEIAGV